MGAHDASTPPFHHTLYNGPLIDPGWNVVLNTRCGGSSLSSISVSHLCAFPTINKHDAVCDGIPMDIGTDVRACAWKN